MIDRYRARPGRAALLFGALLLAAPSLAQSRLEVGATPGGCVQICEDVAYCRDYDIDLKAARCMLILDDAAARQAGLFKPCPAGREEHIEARHADKFALVSSCVPRR